MREYARLTKQNPPRLLTTGFLQACSARGKLAGNAIRSDQDVTPHWVCIPRVTSGPTLPACPSTLNLAIRFVSGRWTKPPREYAQFWIIPDLPLNLRKFLQASRKDFLIPSQSMFVTACHPSPSQGLRRKLSE